jgi:hypothetical protein
MNSGSIRSAGYIAHIGEKINAYRLLYVNLKDRDRLAELRGVKIILKQILKKWNIRV